MHGFAIAFIGHGRSARLSREEKKGGTVVSNGHLRPFIGYLNPGMYFSSGHTICIYAMESTPTDPSSYFELWVIAPDGKRTLYIDPSDAAHNVTIFHDMDETVGTDIVQEWPDSSTLHVSATGTGESEIHLVVNLGSTLGSAILNATIKMTPSVLARTRLMSAISTISLNLLVTRGGPKVAGRTETGRAYLVEPRKLATVKSATATINGDDLGELARPPRPIVFGGDVVIPNRSFFSFGTLNLEYSES